MEESESVEEGQTLVFGLPVENIEPHIQPVECLTIVKGINMETGMPIMITIGSGGLPIWELIGMLEMECARLKHMAIYATFASSGEEDEEE